MPRALLYTRILAIHARDMRFAHSFLLVGSSTNKQSDYSVLKDTSLY